MQHEDSRAGLHTGITKGGERAVAEDTQLLEPNVQSIQTGVLPALIQRHARVSYLSQPWCSGCTGEVLGQRMAEPQPHEHYRDGRTSTREKGDAESLLGSFGSC